MREKFELCCRVLGLAIFCWGVITALTTIPVYFHQVKADTFLPKVLLNSPEGRQLAEEANKAMSRTWVWVTVQLFLQGIAPILLGVYLMRSNNLFVRRCYPDASGPSPSEKIAELQLRLAASASPPSKEQKNDDRYAPPGYHS